jgi:hypothetical protein
MRKLSSKQVLVFLQDYGYDVQSVQTIRKDDNVIFILNETDTVVFNTDCQLITKCDCSEQLADDLLDFVMGDLL